MKYNDTCFASVFLQTGELVDHLGIGKLMSLISPITSAQCLNNAISQIKDESSLLVGL